jgi:hypothetical protein
MGRLHRPRPHAEDDGGCAAELRPDHLQERGVRELGAQRREARRNYNQQSRDLAPQIRPALTKCLMVSPTTLSALSSGVVIELYLSSVDPVGLLANLLKHVC